MTNGRSTEEWELHEDLFLGYWLTVSEIDCLFDLCFNS
jgi:hypothetical protein